VSRWRLFAEGSAIVVLAIQTGENRQLLVRRSDIFKQMLCMKRIASLNWSLLLQMFPVPRYRCKGSSGRTKLSTWGRSDALLERRAFPERVFQPTPRQIRRRLSRTKASSRTFEPVIGQSACLSRLGKDKNLVSVAELRNGRTWMGEFDTRVLCVWQRVICHPRVLASGDDREPMRCAPPRFGLCRKRQLPRRRPVGMSTL
jgi:hypothetical protein